MTLTYKPDLDILPLDLHTKIQVHMSVYSAVKGRHKDAHAMSKLVDLHPPPDTDRGVQQYGWGTFFLRWYEKWLNRGFIMEIL